MRYEPRFHVVLHQPEIPQNTGNIGRTCVATQSKLWLVRPLGFCVDEHHVKRAGMDYWKSLEWQVVDDWAQLERERGVASRFWYLSKFATQTLWDTPFAPGDTLVFGAESCGLPESLRTAYSDRCITVPMASGVRSLNLANTVAITVYEAWRQCRPFPWE